MRLLHTMASKLKQSSNPAGRENIINLLNQYNKDTVFSYCVGVLEDLNKVRNVELIKD